MRQTSFLVLAFVFIFASFPALWASPVLGLALLNAAPWLGIGAFILMLFPMLGLIFAAWVCTIRADGAAA